jgi:hypothetical protein
MEKALDSTCIIYYHGNNWDGVPARQRYFMLAMARQYPVYYLNSARDGLLRVKWTKADTNISVITGLISILSSLKRRNLRWLARLYASWQLRRIRRKYRTVIFWIAENLQRPDEFIAHDLLVFDSIDPCFSSDPAMISAYKAREVAVLEAADLVFASAEQLREECRKRHSEVVLINNACEPEDYRPEVVARTPRPVWWPEVETPIAAYLGTLDERVDVNCLRAACMENLGVQFILAGEIASQVADRFAEFAAMPNVTMPGRISVEDGRFLLANCAIGLIPFILGRMNDAVNPVKMYAYALLGKPILGTSIRELLLRPEIAEVAAGPEVFARRIPSMIELSNDRAYCEHLRSYALQNTWRERATLAGEALEETMRAVGRQSAPRTEWREPAPRGT